MKETTAITGREKYKTIIRSATNEIVADEPIDLNGKDLGFDPGQLLTASLGSCTSITLRMYADRKEWDVEEISVKVTLNDEDKNNPILMRIIEIKANLDEQQKSRLLTIANACPVHKLLSKGIEIITKMKN
ncbi:OsmC family protein [Avrilella dinanensis]|uniref:OsmC family protein n=1 Tax=Avrilella dinanensis TaxID=2008672 RepID=UPI00240A7FB7|nr:OsmC family protein [Avrilella dinanensis]